MEMFRLELEKICQCYLPFAKCHNFGLDSVFRPIQGIKFNKVCEIIAVCSINDELFLFCYMP